MKSLFGKYENYLLVILSAILVGLAFTFDELSLVMWIGFIPFIYVFLNCVKTYRQGIKYGMLFGTIYYFIVLHWIFNLYPLDWMDMSKSQSIVILISGWIFISLLEGAVIGIVVGLYPVFKVKNSIVNIVVMSFLWVILEWVLGIGVLAFTWGRIAVSQVNTLSMVQSASLFGSMFVGFLIFIINGLLTLALMNKGQGKSKVNKYILIATIIFISNITFGLVRLSQKTDGESINVSVIQGNINTAQKWQSGASKEHIKIYKDLTEESVNKGKSDGKEIQMLFWPETALPLNISHSQWLSDEYKNIAQSYGVHFMTGAFHTEFGDVDKDYNSVYSISKNGEIGEPYFKRQLVPFGEMLPFKDVLYKIIPVLKEANLFGSIEPGEEAVVANTEFGKVGSIICFESIFPRLILDTVRDGAEIIFIATNDSWFRDSRAVYQHNNNAVLRAVESNRYVVRAANTGISSVINNKGEVISYIEPLERNYLNSPVQFIDKNTLYSKVGNLIVFISIIGIGVIKIYKTKYNII